MNLRRLPVWRIAATLALVALTVALFYTLVYQGVRTLWALFKPYNLQWALHFVEVGLLGAMALWLMVQVLLRPGRGVMLLRLPGGREQPIGAALVLGSAADADTLTVDGPLVSRRHLRLESRADGSIEAHDLGSTNGTFRRGEDLRRRGGVRVAVGDVLELGRGGPRVEIVEGTAAARLDLVPAVALLVAFVWIGLFLGRQANVENLPAEPMTIGAVAVDFQAFRSYGVLLGLGAAASLLAAASVWACRAKPQAALGGFSMAVLLLVGMVVLYPLLPTTGLRYARAAERAFEDVGAEPWSRLETWERAGGDPQDLLRPSRQEPTEPAAGSPPELGLEPAEQTALVRRYVQGRSALRWATNLGARTSDGTFDVFKITYFRQTAVLIAAALVLLVPMRSSGLSRRLERLPELLPRPMSLALVRAGDRGGSRWTSWLRPFAYWDVLFGFLAAAVVAVTLWTPLGTTLGRGKSLYLNVPGLATIQSVEIVKALFVLFMAGYFARHGDVIAKAPRTRYLAPYLLAVLITLALTGVQADLGGLFMLGLFLTLVFIAATGSFRLVAAVPLLVVPGIGLAWALGLASIIQTRLGIWFSPRTHALGEQIVQARQIFLSSGWTGHAPIDSLAWRLPDVQGDLVIAALGERFGFLGVLALVCCWFTFGSSLLAAARRAHRGASILLASVAALVMVQVLTQAGGAMGLLPLTGVPLPWMSQGLTASLVFTALAALALHAIPASGAAAPEAMRVRSVAYLSWIERGAYLALAAAAAVWFVILPLDGEVGAHGRQYRWEDRSRSRQVERWTRAGLFVADGSRVTVDEAAYRAYVEAGDRDPGLARLEATADALSVTGGEIRARSYLVTNPNHFADRELPRGAIFAADGTVLALTDRRGGRNYPLAESALHPVGYAGGAAQDLGVEAAASDLLRGIDRDLEMRKQAFWNDLRHGPELTLTLDAGLQREAYRQLDGRRGAVVVVRLDDGAILASASSPAADPGDTTVEGWLRLARSAERPLRNRALASTDVYSPPGSVFKIVVAEALLRHELKPKARCTGRDEELGISCAHRAAHGDVDLERALQVSCNVFFARAALELGVGKLRQAAEDFGLNAEAPLNLLRGLGPVKLLAGPSQVLGDPSRAWSDRELARVGFGQGPVSATPLDVARIGAAVARRGLLVEPHLGARLSYSLIDDDGQRREVWHRDAEAASEHRVLETGHARQLTKMLRGVFESSHGTARNLPKLWTSRDGWRLERRSPGKGWKKVAVAGKTGSAWKSDDDETDDAWMVAWAPAERARVVAVALVEDAGEGGKVAGPVVMAMLRDALSLLDAKSAGTE